MMKTMKYVLAAALMAVLLLVAGGCGAEQQDAPAETQTTEEEATMTGRLDEVKDFMFVLTDEKGVSYSFDFEKSPEGLDQIAVGSQITVTYTGEVSPVDPFQGTIVSVETEE